MPKLGSAYRCNLPPRHIWVVISDPVANEGRFVFVNLTTFNENCVDSACVLQMGDYGFLTHTTTVAFSRYHIGDVENMDKLVKSGKFTSMPDIPAVTLQKMIGGAHKSPELPSVAKSMLPPGGQ